MRCGRRAVNHRMALSDAALVKDNHVVAAGGVAGGLRGGPRRASRASPVEVECDTLAQVREVVAAGADLVLLDNMSLDELREAVAVCRAAGVLTEASGGLSLDVARAVAETGVDFLAVGALTHSAPVLDLGVDLDWQLLLTVDVGNTNTVLGLFDGEVLFESYRIKTDPRVTADELALMFRGLLAAHPAPDGVAVCSTVPAVLDAAARDVRALLRRRADHRRRAGRAHRRPAALRQPARGRPGPRRQHPRRAHPLRRPRGRRRLRHVDQLRRRVGARASSSAARSRPASRSASTPSPPAPRGCSRSSWSSRARSSARPRRRRCSRAWSTASPGRSTAWCAGSPPSSGDARRSSPPAGCRT